ncbi:MAG: hypothetical protein JJ863_11775 [Deltaproteobacteria bacterium]|nr:hypothetical protein [Deltaproteobacteria bacterium]
MSSMAGIQALSLREYLVAHLGRDDLEVGMFVDASRRVGPDTLVLAAKNDGQSMLGELQAALHPAGRRLEILSSSDVVSVALPGWDWDLVGDAGDGSPVYDALSFYLERDAPWHLVPRSQGGGAEG